ncbi:MAG: aminotransferase class I/II-fold pyridoxal phosphate-dependent enzyme [Clostridia bacterium]|nr:aminotransferase class I/II-fold pyridoxal phosphate-dependent enzyme [Clostridia bacterium]
MHINTKTIQEGFKPKNGEPRVVPIAQSTTYKYDSSETVGDLFDLKATGHFYTRLSNPTVEAAEIKIAALEGGVGAMCTSSGQSATTLALLNICGSGDHIVSSSAIYGGTFNLFAVTMKKIGIEFTFVSPTATEEELEKAIRPNTKAIFAETLSNPSLDVLNFETYANVAHKNEIPFIVDNTFATPVLCRPFEHGADIIVHSTSKYLDGHAVALGGVIVDSGNFDWTRGKFPEFTRPDESYHGIIYTETFGKSAYIVKARVQMMRDLGNMMSPQNAFLLSLGMETLAIRMERHSENALKVAKWLEQNDKIAWVKYPGLDSYKDKDLADKYMPLGTSGVISYGVKGGREAAMKFMDNLKLAAIVVHVADVRTGVLHPASTTHRQLTDQQLKDCGITPDLIRMSIGIEYVDDIIADIEQALNNL